MSERLQGVTQVGEARSPTPIPIEDAPPVTETTSLSGVLVRPGDVLVIGVEGALADEHAARMGDEIRERLPGLGGVCIIDRTTGIAAYRPEPG